MEIKKIKAIIFDFGGTLDHDGNSWSIRVFNQFKRAGLEIDKSNFDIAEKKSMDQLFDNKESALLSYKETINIYIYWIIKNLELIIKDYKKVLVDPFYDESLKFIERNKKILEKLSKKFTLGIISNNFGNCEGWCNEFNINNYLKIIIDSNIIGYAKPDKKIFEIACKDIGYSFDKCIYIGDKYKSDIKPIIELGILPIWINNSDENADPEVIKIKSLLELEKMFKLQDEIKLLI
jgi:putative hydrolase of the HAD superfamily